MPREFSRTRRVGEQIQRELAQMIRTEIKDPRLGMLTIQSVEVSRDLSHARVYISVMGDDEVREQTLAVLSRASGFLRRLLGREMHLRVIPQLHFQHDDSLDRGLYMSSLIARAVAEDASHHHEEPFDETGEQDDEAPGHD